MRRCLRWIVIYFTLFGLTLITSFCSVLFITMEFHDRGAYSAFGQNLMMSVLFIVMLYRRQSLRGQSLGIALCKLIGTLLASITFFLYIPQFHHSILLPFLYVAILVYDLIYAGMFIQWQKGMKKPAHPHPQRKLAYERRTSAGVSNDRSLLAVE